MPTDLLYNPVFPFPTRNQTKQRSVNISTHKPLPYAVACASLPAPIAVSLAWELWTTPLREGGSWLALKALPLYLPLSGILKGRIYTYQYNSMLVLIYSAEAVVRLFDATPAGRLYAAAAAVCCTVFFVSYMAFVK